LLEVGFDFFIPLFKTPELIFFLIYLVEKPVTLYLRQLIGKNKYNEYLNVWLKPTIKNDSEI